ncbi:hypothetical protein E2320_019815 [Naja naja]|nr:hypothetical protein E2320_019815 [Naja naja]
MVDVVEAADAGDELLSFDDLSPTSDNLSHPTANRPKMPGRRLPTRFNDKNLPTQTQNIEKNVKVHKEEEESAKLKLSECKKPSKLTSPVLTSLPRPSSIVMNAIAGEAKLSQEADEGEKHSLEELRSQIFDLLLAVESLRKEHGKQLEKLKKDLEEEKQMRSNLEMEIEKLKKALITT